jgi:hypothetical protein
MASIRSWNWRALVGPLVTFAGALSYLTWTHRWPALSDVPWLNYAILALGIWLSADGLQRAWRNGRLRRAFASLGLGLSAGIAGLFVWWAAIGSSDLPQGGLAPGSPLPRLSLRGPDGALVELASLPQPLVVVFYRGHW